MPFGSAPAVRGFTGAQPPYLLETSHDFPGVPDGQWWNDPTCYWMTVPILKTGTFVARLETNDANYPAPRIVAFKTRNDAQVVLDWSQLVTPPLFNVTGSGGIAQGSGAVTNGNFLVMALAAFPIDAKAMLTNTIGTFLKTPRPYVTVGSHPYYYLTISNGPYSSSSSSYYASSSANPPLSQTSIRHWYRRFAGEPWIPYTGSVQLGRFHRSVQAMSTREGFLASDIVGV